MELLLNLLWMIVAFSLTAFLVCHQRRRLSPRDWASVLTAILFIAVLLFPAISATDDLYGQLFVSEDSSRRVLQHMVNAPLDQAPAALLYCAALLLLWAAARARFGRMEESSLLSSPLEAYLPASGLRAPPALRSL